MGHLFAYGTLMCEDIMAEVSGCRLEREPGLLEGFSRKAVRGQAYPGIRPDRQGRVEGLVTFDVPAWAWDRLDRFEGPMYAREEVDVALQSGRTLRAVAYVVRPEFLHCLAESDWDFERFLREGKTRFRNHFAGYSSLERDR